MQTKYIFWFKNLNLVLKVNLKKDARALKDHPLPSYKSDLVNDNKLLDLNLNGSHLKVCYEVYLSFHKLEADAILKFKGVKTTTRVLQGFCLLVSNIFV